MRHQFPGFLLILALSGCSNGSYPVHIAINNGKDLILDKIDLVKVLEEGTGALPPNCQNLPYQRDSGSSRQSHGTSFDTALASYNCHIQNLSDPEKKISRNNIQTELLKKAFCDQNSLRFADSRWIAEFYPVSYWDGVTEILQEVPNEYHKNILGKLLENLGNEGVKQQRSHVYSQIKWKADSLNYGEYPVEAAIKDVVIYHELCHVPLGKMPAVDPELSVALISFAQSFPNFRNRILTRENSANELNTEFIEFHRNMARIESFKDMQNFARNTVDFSLSIDNCSSAMISLLFTRRYHQLLAKHEPNTQKRAEYQYSAELAAGFMAKIAKKTQEIADTYIASKSWPSDHSYALRDICLPSPHAIPQK